MTHHPRVGAFRKRIAWMSGVMLPVAALTSSAAPWKWGFAIIYVTIAFGLHLLVRMKDPGAERLAHVMVVSGSSPLLVGWFYGHDLTAVGVLHVVALLATSIGIGYLLGNRVRPQTQRPSTA